ncbi:hypothetical protein [Algiphilus aromaticivorans]|uniref:hypothetical protein n=1 Tax=Algiphilus aromaticivorans TaxID=382454 RepID=UPI0005C140C8|nr:hypothetical protein [Algiphilus aromaticivorans]
MTAKPAITVPRPSGGAVTPRELQQVVLAIRQRIESLESGSTEVQKLVKTQQRVTQALQGQGGGQAPAEPVTVCPAEAEVRAGANRVVAGRFVVALAGGFAHADRTQSGHVGRLAGIAVSGASAQSLFTLRRSGIYEDVNWDWTPGDLLYVGEDGRLVASGGSGQFDQVAAVAISARRVLILLQQTFVRDDSPAGDFLLRSGSAVRQAAAVTEATANAIAKTLADGRFSHTLIPPARIRRAAGAQLTGYRAVTTVSGEAVHADAGTVGHANRVAGIVTNAPADGETALIAQGGELTNAGWSFTPDAQVFLGSNGALTQTPGAGLFQQRVGYATTATTLVVDIGEAIIYG